MLVETKELALNSIYNTVASNKDVVVIRGRQLYVVKRDAIPKGCTSHLPSVARAVDQLLTSLSFTKLAPAQQLNLVQNAEFLNGKINKRNTAIIRRCWLRFLDQLLAIITLGFRRLKCRILDITSAGERTIPLTIDIKGHVANIADEDLDQARQDRREWFSLLETQQKQLVLHPRLRTFATDVIDRMIDVGRYFWNNGLERIPTLYAIYLRNPEGQSPQQIHKLLFSACKLRPQTTRDFLLPLEAAFKIAATTFREEELKKCHSTEQDLIFTVAKRCLASNGTRKWRLKTFFPLCKEAEEILCRPVGGAHWIQQVRNVLTTTPSSVNDTILSYAEPTNSTTFLELLSAAALVAEDEPSRFEIWPTVISELNIDPNQVFDEPFTDAVIPRHQSIYKQLFSPYQRSSRYREYFLKEAARIRDYSKTSSIARALRRADSLSSDEIGYLRVMRGPIAYGM